MIIENLEQIKQAIEIERKHQYINIKGKNQTFARFIKGEILTAYKNSKKSPRWKILLETFERYPYDSMPLRRKAVERLISIINAELRPVVPEIQKKVAVSVSPPGETDVIYIKGVGAKIGYALNKLGIYTANDLLFYFPRKHIDYSNRTLIKKLKNGTNTTIFGHIKSTQAFVTRSKLSVLKVKIADESGSLELNFFYAKANRRLLERYKSKFPIGSGIMVSGTVKLNSFDWKLTLDKPQYSILSEDFLESGAPSNLNLGRIVPIYPLSEGVNIKTLRKAIYNAISIYKEMIPTVIPDYLVQKYNLLEKKEAVEQIHFPSSMKMLERARFSLVFEELFLIQLKLALLREENKHNNAVPLKIKEKGLVNKFIKNLPFELTGAQENAVQDILKDLNSQEPMQRLLQGDVGSGKTVVATIMLLAAVENGYQGAIMAPTEILAQQHYNNLIHWLTPMGLGVGLFLGSNPQKVRTKVEKDLRNGQTHIAVGTHALIQENVAFNNLGAIVIDEQHRFGVKQRTLLKTKAQLPQMLTMTATPIPRTLALTVHGDLDLTIIDELPKGRKPVKTSLITQSGHKDAYKIIRNEIEQGRQAYVVYPLIDESETLAAKAATIEAEYLQTEIFPDFKVGLLHGKLKNDEKERVMADFKNKKYDILVSTTVVEVGVDVPNATVMMIENAERFGLSQLHQLRGRVGRSDLQSYCIISTSTKSAETRDRLEIMTQTNDGFVIAEKDLQIRGPGEFLGVRQSGLPDLIISDLIKDAKILESARNEAIEFVKCNSLDKFPGLKQSTCLNMICSYDLINSG